MGYRKPKKLYHLVWPEGHDLHGLELEMRGLSIGEMTSVAGIGRAPAAGDVIREYGEIFDLFASKLVSWTLEDEDGTPVPPTADAVTAQAADDPMFMMTLVMAWADAVASVDIPLPESSNGGPPSGLEASLPMAPLSPSPSS